tara:strand:- start:1049 stop:1543 length:495 start_codon:yes stop_codon:yes gene_type:complete
MRVDYIIPTIYRETLDRTKKSIRQENVDYNIMTCGTGNSASQNRNKCLLEVKESDWIVFVDDDDYLIKGHSEELDDNYDIVVFRMKNEEHDLIIPRLEDEELRWGNIGINFAIKTDFWLNNKIRFDDGGTSEDWRFMVQVMKRTNKIKITEKIYYIVPKLGRNK